MRTPCLLKSVLTISTQVDHYHYSNLARSLYPQMLKVLNPNETNHPALSKSQFINKIQANRKKTRVEGGGSRAGERESVCMFIILYLSKKLASNQQFANLTDTCMYTCMQCLLVHPCIYIVNHLYNVQHNICPQNKFYKVQYWYQYYYY